jgi:hypothetical protein
VIVTLVAVPFAPELMDNALRHEVTVEATPPGVWTVHQFPPALPETDAGRPLWLSMMHSASYEHPRVHDLLNSWITQDPGPSQPPGEPEAGRGELFHPPRGRP